MKKFYFIVAVCILVLVSACSQSGRRKPVNDVRSSTDDSDMSVNSKMKTVIKMENDNGIKHVWIEINGLRLKFIFDTGASSICISSAEATVLYRQGTLQKEDILDTEYFQDATGKISEGTTINLREVKIGNRILKDVQATVINNTEAPLLLGQSAFQKFGTISIDNTNGTITFE